MVQRLLQLSFSDQLVQMVPQIPAILCRVSLVLMVLAIKTLVAPRGVSSHFVRPFKKRLVLNFLENLMHRFLEHNINRLGVGRPGLSSVISSRSIIVESVRPEIPPFLRYNLRFTFRCYWTLLYLSIWSTSWCTLVTGLPIRDFFKSCSIGRLTLKY